MKKFFSIYKFHILIFISSFLILSGFNFDPDLGWHLALGERFLNSGEIIRKDQFSWTMPGFVWGNSYFLYQVFTAFLFSNFGYLLTVFTYAAIGALAFWVILPRQINLWMVAFSQLGTFLAVGNLGIRPHSISLLFFAVLIRFLYKKQFSGRGKLWFWFLFFALWANFHNAFLIGLFAYGSFRFMDLLTTYAAKKKLKIGEFGLSIMVPLTATLFTPFGLNLWKSILNDAAFSEMYTSILEWHSLILIDEFRLFYAISGVIFIWVLHNNFAAIGPKMAFLSGVFFMMPFLGAYFAFFWAVMFVFTVCNYQKLNITKQTKLVQKFALAMALLVLGFLTFNNFIKGYLKAGTLEKSLAVHGYPVKAVDYMKIHKISNNIFNVYQWGGYLDWQYAEAKVFIDGRMTGWRRSGKPILLDYLATKDGVCRVSQQYEIKTLLVERGANVSCFKDFERVYADETAEVWVRKQLTN